MTASKLPDCPMSDAAALADALTRLAGHAMTFGRINRSVCRYHDGTPESDSDHTAMLTWVAPALAAQLYPADLDAGLVALFAAWHDAVEVFAGDTPTLVISAAELEEKRRREREAAERWYREFGCDLPFVPAVIARYESQQDPEARFVKAVDKCLPKLLHAHAGFEDLADEGKTAAELRLILDRQLEDVAQYAGEFTALMDLMRELADRTAAGLAALEDEKAGALT